MTPTQSKKTNLEKINEEELLQVRMCDLGLQLRGSWVEGCARQLQAELDVHGLDFRPRVYIGDEWFSPDGVAAIAVPFFLFHPRLMQLEKKMMLELEGGTPEECMQLLRHECGHALCHAFNLLKRPGWKKTFGDPKSDYDNFFRYRPYSRSFVHNLKGWYAQSHPEEDFAETFAVWLNPASDWKKRYLRWPALKKLRYIEKLIPGLKDCKPKTDNGELTYQARNLKGPLSRYYAERHKLYDEETESYFDNDLGTIFTEDKTDNRSTAADFLRDNGGMFEIAVSRWARERKFTVRRLLKQLTRRCRALKLYMPDDAEKAEIEFAAYLSALVSNYIHTARFKRRV